MSTNNDDAAESVPTTNNTSNNNNQHEHANVNMAFVVSYVGTPFQGSQIQSHHHPVNTVEGLLISALDKINLINANLLERYEKVKYIRNLKQGQKGNNNNNLSASQNQFRAIPPQLGLGRTSRTDRGVSALCNVFNMYCKKSTIKSFGTIENLIDAANKAIHELVLEHFVNPRNEQEKINRPVLVIQAVQEVPQNFFGRFCANRRVYRYLIPAFALDPPRSKTLPSLPGSWLFEKKVVNNENEEVSYKRIFTSEEEEKLATTNNTNSSFEETASQHYASRAEKANDILKNFLGYHRFHNYTGREVKSSSKMETSILGRDAMHACDQEALRNIYRAEVLRVPLYIKTPKEDSDTSNPTVPFYYTPHYIFQIDGGSFLLHMIRKIVGTMIAIVRGAREELIELSLSPDKIVNTPMAPARYLCQSRVFFESYEQLRPEKYQQKNLPFLANTIEAANAKMEIFETESIFAEMVHLDVTSKSLFLDAPGDDINNPQENTAHTKEQLDLLARQKKNKEQKAALETISEMRRFIRMCPMHNWSVAENPEKFRPKPKVDKEEKKKAREDKRRRQRGEDNDDDDANEDEIAPDDVMFEDFSGDVVAPVDENNNNTTASTETKPDNGVWLDKSEMAAAAATPRVQFAWEASWMTVDEIKRRNNKN